VRSGAGAVHALGDSKIILASGFFCDTAFVHKKDSPPVNQNAKNRRKFYKGT